MTDELCEHYDAHEWHKEISMDGTVDHLHCHECGREWSFERDHTLSEALEMLGRQIRQLGHDIGQSISLR